MPWCPNCRAEYREGFTFCSDCNIQLVQELDNVEIVYDREAFLITAENDMEAKIIENLLQSHDIPVLRKYKGSGEYLQIYMGVTVFGIDLFVPSGMLGLAKELLDTEYKPLIEYGEDTIEEEVMNNSKLEADRKRRIKAWIIALLFMPGLLWGLASIIMQAFR